MIPFNKIYLTGNEQEYISKALNLQTSGDGIYTKKCNKWLENLTGAEKVLLTNSCTAALEIAAILINIQPGDEVIMPSYTFVSTANAFVLRGAIPVFVDINEKDLQINVEKIEKAITIKTKAIIPVHYGGNCCDMEKIIRLAKKYNLFVIEDAAQSIESFKNGKHVGSMGDLSTFSFHQTKNISCGEGGALVINNPKLTKRAEIIREKGTNRSDYLNKEISFYTWIDIGSSHLASDINAACLWAQFEESRNITAKRLELWNTYRKGFIDLEKKGKITLQSINNDCQINAHIFYILLKNQNSKEKFINLMHENSIKCQSHYVALHSSPYGKKVGKLGSSMKVTDSVINRIVRLPIWIGLDSKQDFIIEKSTTIINNL